MLVKNLPMKLNPKLNIHIQWEQTEKQKEAWVFLEDIVTEEVLFGGGAGGAKSNLGVMWLIVNCLKYKGSRWFMGRKEGKDLKESTLLEFFDCCKRYNIIQGHHYNYSQQRGIIKWANGSEIWLIELPHKPSDPNYNYLGSRQYCGGFVDEANEISERCKDTLKIRCRYKLDEFGIIGKVFMSCNPTKGWIYRVFFKPWKKGALPRIRAFIQSLAQDNPFLPDSYLKTLLNTDDPMTFQRLVKGNWEYDDDSARLFDYDKLFDMFFLSALRGEKILSVDAARKGVDRMPIYYWEGLQVADIIFVPKEIKENTSKSADFVLDIADKKGVSRSRIIIDEGGIGGGVIDNIEGCTGFISQSSPFEMKEEVKDTPNYKHEKKLQFKYLKDQCAFMLRKLIKNGEIGFSVPEDRIYEGYYLNKDESEISGTELRELIIEEFSAQRQKDIDKESKVTLIPKELVKQALRRSPDLFDTALIRMYYLLVPQIEPFEYDEEEYADEKGVTAGMIDMKF